MELLPDDLWHQILKIGTETERLDHKDLCSLSMTCHRFDELAQDSDLWATLLYRDILTSYDEAPSKAFYKEEFKKDISIWREFEEFEAMMANWSFTPQVSEPFYEYDYDEFPFFLESTNIYHPEYYGLGFSDDDNTDDANDDNSDDANDILFQFIGRKAIDQSSSSPPTNVPTKKKFPKRRNKGLRPQVYPNNKSYIPMHKPPRRAMARKI